MELPLISKLILYAIIILMGLMCILLWGWQFRVLQGRAMKNPDGSIDDWHEQKLLYGTAVADMFIAVPVALMGIIFIFLNWRFGYFLTALASFWYIWGNVMTTATSLRFQKPRLTVNWLFIFPFQIVVGLAYLIWLLLHFQIIFGSLF